MAIIDEIKESFKKGSVLTRLIYVNLAVFVAVKLIQVLFSCLISEKPAHLIIGWLAVPASFSELLSRPWTIFTYMFLHEGFLHILFNILWLYWLGRIFLEYLDGRKLLGVYILGGLAGAALYILAFNLFPAFEQVLPVSRALGASAAVLAVVISISVYVPNYTIYLLFLGPVKLNILQPS
jgi:membrane associated rhomboid family serine protease